MQVPFHPIIVHLPLALTFILPLLLLAFAYFIKSNKMSPSAWLIIIGFQAILAGSGYLALETGETDEKIAAKVVSKSLIHEHEEKAEIFVGVTVLALVVSVAAFFIKKDLQFYLQLGVVILSLVACFLAYRTGESGGELVYRYGAAGGHIGKDLQLMSPAQKSPTGMSQESSISEENESLKTDDHDYGNQEEMDGSVDEDFLKQED